jgi:hypothetical protein
MRYTAKECRLCETLLLLLGSEKANYITHNTNNRPSPELI